MEIKKLKKYSIYTLIGFIILIITKIINISIEEETFIIRKLQFITGYFVTFPIIIICSVFAIKVVIYYVSIKFKYLIKYFLMIIPFVVFMIWFATLLIL